MDVFGPHWYRHHQTIERHWRSVVGEDDLVLVPGDISWGMKIPEAQADLNFLGSLPGRSVIIKGNHDYWWSSAGRVRRVLPEGMFAVHGDVVRIDDILICGTRMWDAPDLSFEDLIDWQPNPVSGRIPRSEEQLEQDRKIYEREWARLQGSLEKLSAHAQERSPRLRIALTHYPPVSSQLEPCARTELFERHCIDHVVFGHLHSVFENLDPKPFGTRNGVTYHLTSCDYIQFRPVLIADLS